MTSRIIDYNYDICFEKWDMLNRTAPKKYPVFIEGLIRLVYFSLRSFKFLNLFVSKNEHIFLTGSYNQYVVLGPVAKKTNSSRVLTFHTMKIDGISHIPEILFYLMGLCLLPLSLVDLFRSGKEMQRESMIRRMERLSVSGASFYVWRFLFWLWCPKSLVVSNDHNHWPRSAVRAANEMGIDTIYIPHSFTSESFPPLECKYSLLESVIQKNKYKNIGSEIKITGSVRFEGMVSKCEQRTESGVVVCFNDEDCLNLIEEIIKSVSKLDRKAYVKPHPADTQRHKLIKELSEEHDLKFCDPFESIYVIKDDVSYVAAGVSGVHIDALMFGLIPVTTSKWYKKDYYNLISEEMIIVLDNLAELDCVSNDQITKIFSNRSNYNDHLKNTEKLPSDIISSLIDDLEL